MPFYKFSQYNKCTLEYTETTQGMVSDCSEYTVSKKISQSYLKQYPQIIISSTHAHAQNVQAFTP